MIKCRDGVIIIRIETKEVTYRKITYYGDNVK